MIKLKKTLFQKFLKILNYNGGEGGSNPRTSCPVAGFQDQCFQPLSHLSSELLTLFITIKVNK